jgi:hypothetical protein
MTISDKSKMTHVRRDSLGSHRRRLTATVLERSGVARRHPLAFGRSRGPPLAG